MVACIKTTDKKYVNAVYTYTYQWNKLDTGLSLNKYSDVFLKKFNDEIENFKKLDASKNPESGLIIFTGSSSIRKWKTLENDMYPIKVLNRAIGGAEFPHILYNCNALIFAYKPRSVVIYCGENDLGNSNLNPSNVKTLFHQFQSGCKQIFPDIKIVFISIKPSPARKRISKKICLTNALLKKYCEQSNNLFFIDIESFMVDDGYIPIPEMFTTDSLHLSTKGYEVWAQVIKRDLQIFLKNYE